jgi:hypothetical protein
VIKRRIKPHQHVFGEIIHTLKPVAPRHHQLTKRKPRFQPALLRLPGPPAGFDRSLVCLCSRVIRSPHRTGMSNTCQQFVHAGTLIAMHLPGIAISPVMSTLFAPTAMQGNIHGRNKTRLVRPAFDQLTPASASSSHTLG